MLTRYWFNELTSAQKKLINIVKNRYIEEQVEQCSSNGLQAAYGSFNQLPDEEKIRLVREEHAARLKKRREATIAARTGKEGKGNTNEADRETAATEARKRPGAVLKTQ